MRNGTCRKSRVMRKSIGFFTLLVFCSSLHSPSMHCITAKKFTGDTEEGDGWEPVCKLSGARNLTLEGKTIPDCNCNVNSVDEAVTYFLSPLLTNLTERIFFRYFYIDLEKPCPFWSEDGQCMIKDCSVCTCAENEIPPPWLATPAPTFTSNSDDFIGWVSPSTSKYGFGGKGHDESLGQLDYSTKRMGNISSQNKYIQHLIETEKEEVEDWTFIAHEGRARHADGRGVYVNLLENPERYTGYAGPSAQRVWHAIQQENCFGGLSDTCLEKRIFFRLMSGLQSSISTHIARNYLNTTSDTWVENPDLFMRAVGDHPDRLQNLYFAFLFVLRSVIKAGDIISSYSFNTGNATDDAAVRELIAGLVGKSVALSTSAAAVPYSAGEQSSASSSLDSAIEARNAVEECKHGFDESEMFHIADDYQYESSSAAYGHPYEDKHKLREEFKSKFRNISLIMDCVGCEKCRLWGKLQILGIGTAIKVLLMAPADSGSSCQPDVKGKGPKQLILNRQELIALINTLNNLAKSIVFASSVMRSRQSIQQKSQQSATGTEDEEVGDAGNGEKETAIVEVRTNVSSDLYLVKMKKTAKLKLKTKSNANPNRSSSEAKQRHRILLNSTSKKSESKSKLNGILRKVRNVFERVLNWLRRAVN